MSEAYLQAQIIQRLRNSGYFVIKQESPPAPKGVPDLLVCKGDNHIWIELKVGKNKLSNSQKSCHVYMSSFDQKIYVCYSWEEVCFVLRTCQVFNKV